MQPRKFKVAIVSFPYGGNGGTSSEHPDVRNWLLKTVKTIHADPRIEEVYHRDFNDTPVTMVRNEASYWAQEIGADILVMVDSDQAPDLYAGQPGVKPFWDSSFEFLYAHWDKGPVAIFAPYCGPPSHPTRGGFENPYVFRWVNKNSDREGMDFSIEAYSRAEAAYQSGIQEAAAGPTGLCMIDIRCFDHLEDPRFYYEYAGDGAQCPTCHHPVPGKQTHKDSTEDVVFFRNLSQSVIAELGYNPVFCNWDAWAGHWKPWCVGKPNDIKADQVNKQLAKVVLSGQKTGWSNRVIRRNPNLPVHPDDAGGVKQPKGGYFEFVKNFGRKIPEKSISEQCNELTRELGQTPPPRTDAFAAEDEPSNMGHMTCEGDLKSLVGLVKQHTYECRNQPVFRCVELGSWTGKSAIAIAEAVEVWRGQNYELHCVDSFDAGGDVTPRMLKAFNESPEGDRGFDPVFETFKKNLGARFNRQVFPHRNTTADAVKSWKVRAIRGEDAQAIDFLFIDAGHSYEDVKLDIALWAKFVRPGGIICGHDYGYWDGVTKAVDEAYPHRETNHRSLWWTTKTPEPVNANGQGHESHAH